MDGSNAPHLVGEDFDSFRTTRLLSRGSSGDLTFLELEREGAQNYIARRQVIHWKPNLWLVLDNTSGSERSHTSTTWTSSPEVRWEQGQTAGSFLLESAHANEYVNMFFLGTPDTKQSLVRGSSRPFAGWQLEHHLPAPAYALVVEQPTMHSWAATLWTCEKSRAFAKPEKPPQMKQWTDATNWEIQLPSEAGGVALRREGNMLRLHPSRGTDEVLELGRSACMSALGMPSCAVSLRRLPLRYPLFSANLTRRKKVTYLLLGILLLQLIFFTGYKRTRGPFLQPLKFLTAIAWIVGGVWLFAYYF